MRNRRTRKPGTVSGLSGYHLGMTVRIEGTDYHLTHVRHQRRTVIIVGEWDDPNDETTYLYGDRGFPPSTHCTVVDWRAWFRPTLHEKIKALRGEEML